MGASNTGRFGQKVNRCQSLGFREYINLRGDYLWCSSAKIGAGQFRLLEPA